MRLSTADRGLTHLIVRRDHILCTICKTAIPIHPGDGTPLGSYLMALKGAILGHPVKEHTCPRP